MTSNQVAYAAHLEDVRHNTVSEQETERSNKAREAETSRHNQVWEQETSRHNQVVEQQGWASLEETNRHNLATEDIGRQQVDFQRANLRETVRHNAASENLQAYANESNRISAIGSYWQNQDQRELTKAKTAQTKKETGLADQKNVQGWINSISGAVRNVGGLGGLLSLF